MNRHAAFACCIGCAAAGVAAAVAGHIVLAFTLTLAALFLLAESQREAR